MAETSIILTETERDALARLASPDNLEGQRAMALLALGDGMTRPHAAAAAGLTAGQLDYVVRRFRQDRLALWGIGAADSGDAAATPPTLTDTATRVAAAPAATVEATTDDATAVSATELRALVKELNDLVAELHATVPTTRAAASGTYSPAGLLTLLRDNVQKLTPDVQSGMLQSFQGMTTEDLLDIDTWKGMAYMLTYSARFQADQVKGKVNETINEVVPEPIQPGRLWSLGRSSLDKVSPDFAKQLMSMFEGAKPRDLVDPDTWKGVWHMLNYSLQFQAEQLKERLTTGSQSAE